MHVHVSLSEDNYIRWTKPQILSILNAIPFLEDATTKLMPALRKQNPWAASNVFNRRAPEQIKQAY
jgi:hypothetical protein